MISKNILTLLVLLICFDFLLANNENNAVKIEEDMSLSDLNEAMEELKNCNLDSNPGADIDIKFKEAMVQLGIDKSETINRATFCKSYP